MLLNLNKSKWSSGLKVNAFDEQEKENEKVVLELKELATKYEKAVEEEGKLTAQELANTNADRRARGDPEVDAYGREVKGTGKKGTGNASSDKYDVGKSLKVDKDGRVLKDGKDGGKGIATKGAGRPGFHTDPYKRHTWRRSVVRHLPAWACCVRGSWSASAAPGESDHDEEEAVAAADEGETEEKPQEAPAEEA